MPKAAEGDNELTRFRFDAVVTVAGGDRSRRRRRLRYFRGPGTAARVCLSERLSSATEAFGYSAIPNRRLTRPLWAIAWIDGEGAPDAVLDIPPADETTGLDPAVVRAVARRMVGKWR